MTSIGVAGSTRMQSWMVDMLFGQPGQGKAAPPPAASAAAPALSVASAAKSAIAPATGQAVAALQAGGTGAAVDAGSADTGYLTVAQSNTLIESNNAMTSAQISATYYSGRGLRETGTGEIKTFADIVQMERDAAQTVLDFANDPIAAAAAGQDPNFLRAEAAKTNAYADSMQKAFDNHTLVIQKLSDVPGLHFTQREMLTGPDQNSGAEGMTWTGGYDQQALKDFISQFSGSKQVGTPFLCGVDLLLTWTDENMN